MMSTTVSKPRRGADAFGWHTGGQGGALTFVALLLLWEIAGRMEWVAAGALPAPSAILAQAWSDRAWLPRHVGATLLPAGIGFVAGNLVAASAAILFCLSPAAERVARGINIAIFAIPPIALAPILVLTFDGIMPQILLAAIACYFPTMVAMLVGLTEIDPRPADVIHGYGGSRWEVMRYVRLRSSVPGLLAGLKVAAPASVLGAILAEFGSGSRWGLGSFLLGSLGEGNPARIWEIGLTATLVAGLGYAICSVLARRAVGSGAAVTLSTGSRSGFGAGQIGKGSSWALTVAAFLAPFLAWWALLWWLDVSPIIAKNPFGLWDYMVTGRTAVSAQERLWEAVWQTIPLSLLGLLVGLAFAAVLAVLVSMTPRLGNPLLAVAMVTQTMPLVALTPIIVLIFGRDLLTTLIVAGSVTFFPAFATISQGLALTPKPALDVLGVYGASPMQRLRYVAIPSAAPYIAAAARVSAPQALLGVMIAEWLATGTGLGNLLNHARGRLDYGMIWAVAFVSVALSILLYQIVRMIERAALRKYSGSG